MTLDALIDALISYRQEHPDLHDAPVVGDSGDQVNVVEMFGGAVFLRPGQKLSKSTS